MIQLVAMFSELALLVGAIAVISAALHGQLDTIVAALAGRSPRAEAAFVPAPRVRVTVRRLAMRPAPRPLLRAAA